MLILPSYKMTLLERLRDAIWARYASYEKVRTYFDLWCNVYKSDGRYGYFEIEYADSEYKKIDKKGSGKLGKITDVLFVIILVISYLEQGKELFADIYALIVNGIKKIRKAIVKA